jgi:hypothetical protein
MILTILFNFLRKYVQQNGANFKQKGNTLIKGSGFINFV